jgi:hypothetical protein
MAMFSAQINAWIEKTKGDADKVVRYALGTVDGRLVTRSIVGDGKYWKRPPPAGYAGGRFKGNWQMSIDSPATGVKDLIDRDGSATIAAHASVLSTAKAGHVYYIVNNLPYAKRIEEGWSRQAPYGIVALTVVEWNNIVENAVNGVKAGGGDMAAGFGAYPL